MNIGLYTIGIMGYILGLYWGYIGIMEKKMEATIGIIGVILGLYGLHTDDGKENGNYYLGFRVWDL